MDIPVEPLYGSGLKEGMYATPGEQAVHSLHAERDHIRLVAPDTQAFFPRGSGVLLRPLQDDLEIVLHDQARGLHLHAGLC